MKPTHYEACQYLITVIRSSNWSSWGKKKTLDNILSGMLITARVITVCVRELVISNLPLIQQAPETPRGYFFYIAVPQRIKHVRDEKGLYT